MPSKSDRNHKKITAADIARESGYSLTAVSFAFNKPTRISTEVREKILEAADRLGYTPDPGARKFAMGRQLAIGFLLPQEADSTMSNPYILGILRGVVKVCETKAYTLSILPPIKSSINKAIQNAAVDGFITVGLTITDKIKQNFDRRGLPIVTIGGDITDDITNINIDDEAAVRESHKNPEITALYSQSLERPGSHLAHELLHCEYRSKKAEKSPSDVRKLWHVLSARYTEPTKKR